MTSRSTRALGLVALPLVLALTACGGGSSSGSDPAPTPTQRDRIEPYDPGAAKAGGSRFTTVVRAATRAARTSGTGGALARCCHEGSHGVHARHGFADRSGAQCGGDGQCRRHGGIALRGRRCMCRVPGGLHSGAARRGVAALLQPPGGGGGVTAQALDAQTQRNAEGGASHRAARTYWSPEFCTAEATLEIEIPAQAPLADVQIAVPGLSHFTHSAAEAESSGQARGNATRKVGESGGCNLDATCSPEYLEQSRAVARMVYVKDGDSYLCTGALMNDATASATPLLPQRTPLHLQPGRGRRH
jgi:lysyl endopeptidase